MIRARSRDAVGLAGWRRDAGEGRRVIGFSDRPGTRRVMGWANGSGCAGIAGTLACGEFRVFPRNFKTAGEIPSRRLRFRYNPLQSGEMAEWLKAAVC